MTISHSIFHIDWSTRKLHIDKFHRMSLNAWEPTPPPKLYRFDPPVYGNTNESEKWSNIASAYSFRVEWQEPIAVPLGEGKTLYTSPLPGSGSILAFILNVIQGWIGKGSSVPAGSPLYWQRFVETFKFAYGKRTGLGDASRLNLPYNISQVITFLCQN